MTEPGSLQPDAMATAHDISRLVLGSGRTVAAAEWFRGAVVAYSREVKFDVLGAERGPVITPSCARQMARGVAELLGADFAVAVTGAGGPGPEEGKPQGTTFIAACSSTDDEIEEHHFTGEPEDVVYDTVRAALALLHRVVERNCS